MKDLRSAVAALPTPKRHQNDANGNWFTTDMEYGWDCGVEAVMALIPESAVLVTKDSLAAALHGDGWGTCLNWEPGWGDECGPDKHQEEAVAVLERLK